jgi:hypothetical protein
MTTIRSKSTGQFLTVRGNWRHSLTAKDCLVNISTVEGLATTRADLIPIIARRHKLDLTDLELVRDAPFNPAKPYANPF